MTPAEVTETSRKAYYNAVLDGVTDTQATKIMALLLTVRRPITRHEISNLTGIPLHTVCARVKGLIGDKERPDFITVDHKGPDPITGNLAEFLVPVPEAWEQRRMF